VPEGATNGATRQGMPPTDRAAYVARQDMIPTDGSIVHAGNHVSIYCAPCARWIDCHLGVPPETALARHAALVH
jgi:hypothetical protein